MPVITERHQCKSNMDDYLNILIDNNLDVMAVSISYGSACSTDILLTKEQALAIADDIMNMFGEGL